MQFAKINGSGPGRRRKIKIIDELFIYLSTYVRKINVSGSTFCIYCNKLLVYGNTGKKDILKNSTKSTGHLSSEKTFLSTTLLPLH